MSGPRCIFATSVGFFKRACAFLMSVNVFAMCKSFGKKFEIILKFSSIDSSAMTLNGRLRYTTPFVLAVFVLSDLVHHVFSGITSSVPTGSQALIWGKSKVAVTFGEDWKERNEGGDTTRFFKLGFPPPGAAHRRDFSDDMTGRKGGSKSQKSCRRFEKISPPLSRPFREVPSSASF